MTFGISRMIIININNIINIKETWGRWWRDRWEQSSLTLGTSETPS